MEEMNKSKKLEPPTKPMNPLDYVKFDINLELIQPINKSKDLPSMVNQIAIETVNTLYPNNRWTRIYADGSKLNEETGAGIYSELFYHYFALNSDATVFEAELFAN